MDLIAWGDVVPTILEGPENERLSELLQACEAHPDFEVVELRRIDGSPTGMAIIVDAGDGTVAPANPVGIQRRERLALTFRPDCEMPVEVRALRREFPVTLHQNSVAPEEPRSLCLYELDWSTVERTWTSQSHLRQILRWLEKTADGSLHEGDQALEQLFFATGEQVVVPAGLARMQPGETAPLRLAQAVQTGRRATLVVEEGSAASNATPGFDLLPISLVPITHLPVQTPPHTLGELQDRLTALGTTLFPALLEAIRARGAAGIEVATIDKSRRVLLLASIPREVKGPKQRVDVRGFVVEIDLARLGLAMDVLRLESSTAYSFQLLSPATPLSEPTQSRWRDYTLYPVDVRFGPDRAMAQWMSGVAADEAEFYGVLAGTGALGSVLAELWMREGWGYWDLVDPDILESHNPIRHVVSFSGVGQAKATLVRRHVDGLLETPGVTTATSIVARVNESGHEDLDAALSRARLLVDATTTIDAPRDLSERDGPRIISVFLTPSGLGAVLLMEDAQRDIRVSSLEAQYYRALLNESWGLTHLNVGQQARTGAGCRDRSLIMSSELIQLFGAQLARRIRLASATSAAQICVWTLDDRTGAIAFDSVTASATRSVQRGLWQVRWDEALEQKLEHIRRGAFPSETGGVLVGVVDQKLRTVHLVDGWNAPADSQADESGFTRGKFDVTELLEECNQRTQRMVGYVGEWHSHPPGLSNCPSDLDTELLATLTMQLTMDGVPAVMAIAGENGLGISLGQVS